MTIDSVTTDPADQKLTVLAVDDDPEVLHVISATLGSAGYELWTAENAEDALGLLDEHGLPHLAVIDINLPKMDGLSLTKKIQDISDVPVIMLTVVDDRATVVDTIQNLAEDYIIKPFNPAELAARVGRILKRIGDFSYTHQPLIQVDEHLAVDFVHQRVIINERPLALTPTETKLLYILMRDAGKTIVTKQILKRVWPDEDADENTLRVHIHRLRQKIEISPSRPRYVVTERGAGYSFATLPGGQQA